MTVSWSAAASVTALPRPTRGTTPISGPDERSDMTTTTTPADALTRIRAAEMNATELRCHATRRLPGYLQCPELTRAVHAATHQLRPLAVTADGLVEHQEQRRHAMRAEHRASTTVLLDEELLHRIRDDYGAELAQVQLNYLYAPVTGIADWFGGDKTTIRIIRRGCCTGLPVPVDEFTLITVAGAAQQDVVCVEATCGVVGALDGKCLTERWQLEQIWETWNLLHAAALDHDGTLRHFHRLCDERS